ncbi:MULTISPECIES: type II toxin-antitoxin system CcdA family antitoxin [unclassified Alteromonas]|uniref:type II toxin-antitoxin system CcdA family antitoxin n=1 Tax=unclassified Alteromonas TaxID=2614992 RepID=UPI0005094FD4|nr:MULTISPECIES: type II toxin-antitoxin system CcdA family antitoxin [unclassified Alteromonas]
MDKVYDLQAPKKATNVSINSDLLQKARKLKVNLSATLESAIEEKLKVIEAEQWRKDNKQSIEKYNDFVEENGLLSDEHRAF